MDGHQAFLQRGSGGVPVVNIVVSARLAQDLGAMQGITAKIADLLGCGGCHSGFDYRFRHDLVFWANAEGKIFNGAASGGLGEPIA